MKIKVASLAILILLAACVLVQAKQGSDRLFFLQTPITMDGVQIPHGMYELTFESSSNASVRVTFRREGQFIATARGVWVKGGRKYMENSVLLRVNSDGSRSLTEIRLAGTAKTIVLDSSDTAIRLSAR